MSPPSDNRERPGASQIDTAFLRLTAIAIALLTILALIFGMYSGAPWLSKETGQRLVQDLEELERSDATSVTERRVLQADLQHLRMQVDWLMQEVERLKQYVYPQTSGRDPNPRYRP